MSVIVCYIPVLHEGYRRLFENHPDAKELYLFGADVIGEFDYLIKDIRKLDPELVKKSIEAWGRFDRVHILDANSIKQLQEAKTPLIMSDDELTEALVERYFTNNPIEKDTIFLRWDKKKSIEPVQISPDVTISVAEFDRQMMSLISKETTLSKDWWWRMGALVVKDGEVILTAHNEYVPSDQIANSEGDPRSNFKSGQHLESSLALHAEAGLVARAAKAGISLLGCEVYCEAFPCPPCAKQLAYSGVKRVFYRNGYSVLDGERILKSQGVEIVYVK